MIQNRQLLLLLLGLFCARLTSAQDFGRPLTQEQVDCEERQLMRLQHRAVFQQKGSQLFFWRASPTGGAYRGLAVAAQLTGDNLTRGTWERDEVQLPFDLILRQEDDFLDPRRPRLPQATLVRRGAAGNLFANPRDFQAIDVQIDLAPVVPNPFEPRMPLHITNNPAAGAGQADRAGRSLATDDLLSACHAEVTEFDLKVFSLMARTVRPSECLLENHGCGPGPSPLRVVLFRGTEPLTYRMNLVDYGLNCYQDDPCYYLESTTAFLFHLQVNARGDLTGGDVQALGWCAQEGQLGCHSVLNPDFALFVMPPLRPGLDKQGPPEFRRSAELQIYFEGFEGNILHDTINWADLLRDTAWNGGLVP
ncbi:MAG TPA: hypothetical protein DD490_20480 [Acidobacteria bacterium]|nr:hypothetical protein [Acidobacteriota bacterium]